MRLFIAEKPDLAKDIGAALAGTYSSEDGYFIKGDNIITWAFGHLLRLAMPEEYNKDLAKWRLEDYPLKIDEFKYLPIDGSKKQLTIIKKLVQDSRVTEIIHCGDPDEEGQILIDEILKYCNNKKPVLRALLQDTTPKGVQKELLNLKPNANYHSLSEAGFARSQADWVVGINLTRAYTAKAKNSGFSGALSVGRVQTPILGLIVSRDLEHESHKASFYYSVGAEFDIDNKIIKANLKIDEKIEDEKVANDIKNACQNKIAKLSKAEHLPKVEQPPLPYNLLVLQVDCSKKFGYKPDKVMQITQSLREKHKLITYNRSDCQYLPENMHQDSPEVLNAIAKTLGGDYLKIVSQADTSIKSEAFNDANITAHFAIIPTAKTANLNDLSKDELNVYELIAKRFILQFYPPKEYIHSSLEFNVSNYTFTASANKITKAGYFSVFGSEIEQNEDESDVPQNKNIDFTAFKSGQAALCKDVYVEKKQTKPKPYYTIASLLNDIKSISKYVKDEKIKKLLKEKDAGKKGENGSIGTPATRSEHINVLFKREYIAEKGKNIVSTQKGRDLIAIAPTILTQPDLTALWFEEQKDIIAGKLTKEQFLQSVFDVVDSQIQSIKDSNEVSELATKHAQKPKDTRYPCKCGQGYLQRRQNQKGTYWWGCSNWKNGCKNIYYDNNGKPNIK